MNNVDHVAIYDEHGNFVMTRPALTAAEETAPAEGAEIRITDLARVTLGPDDALLVRLPVNRTAQDREKVRGYVKAQFPDHKVLVLPADCEMAVIQAQGADSA